MTQKTFARDRTLQSLSASSIANSAAQARVSLSDELAQLGSSADGLSQAEAAARLGKYGPNAFAAQRRAAAFRELIQAFLNPLVIACRRRRSFQAARRRGGQRDHHRGDRRSQCRP